MSNNENFYVINNKELDLDSNTIKESQVIIVNQENYSDKKGVRIQSIDPIIIIFDVSKENELDSLYNKKKDKEYSRSFYKLTPIISIRSESKTELVSCRFENFSPKTEELEKSISRQIDFKIEPIKIKEDFINSILKDKDKKENRKLKGVLTRISDKKGKNSIFHILKIRYIDTINEEESQMAFFLKIVYSDYFNEIREIKISPLKSTLFDFKDLYDFPVSKTVTFSRTLEQLKDLKNSVIENIGKAVIIDGFVSLGAKILFKKKK